MAARPTDHLIGMVRVTLAAPHNRRHFLTTLRPETFDQVRAVLCIQRGIIAVMELPDPALCRINQLLNTGNGIPRSELCEPILALSKDAGAGWKARAQN